jgi:BirA family biotin operon repressor/biotin-[acetyl-CoA-carboxylase] ligase
VTNGRTILEIFYRANGQFVARAQVPATEIAALGKLGYQFESHPHHGYRLLAVPDRLTADDIQARLVTNVIGREIIVFEETGSTNDVVADLARHGAKEGLVVFAESQTKGRGRQGRAWVSARGKGLWFSVLLRPTWPVHAMPRLTVAASVAVARVIRQTTGLDARIKWPNDVTIQGRKVAGILTELHGAAAILGVGLDVNCRSEDLPPGVPATSLAIETGEPQERPAIAAALLAALDELYATATTNFDAVVAQWAAWSTTLGKQLVVQRGQQRLEGHAAALDGDGTLLLRKDNGQTERLTGAEVMVEK